MLPHPSAATTVRPLLLLLPSGSKDLLCNFDEAGPMQCRVMLITQQSVVCRFVGTIPAALGTLDKLEDVDLSNNLLSGFLPEISKQLPNLTVV